MAESAPSPSSSLPQFPIQLRKVDISEVSYRCQAFSDSAVSPTESFELNVSVTRKPEDGESMQVALVFNTTNEPKTSSVPFGYSLSLALHGDFRIGPAARTKLGEDGIKRWGEKNGALVLLPFLREAVYTFTQKTGFKPILIPLIETAAFRVTPPPAEHRPENPEQAGALVR